MYEGFYAQRDYIMEYSQDEKRIKTKPTFDPLRKTLIPPKSISVLGVPCSHFTFERIKIESL